MLQSTMILLGMLGASLCGSVTAPEAKPEPPRVFLLDGKYLQAVKEAIRQGAGTQDLASLRAALAALEADAKAALAVGNLSVVNKDAKPPSGDKHDFMSQAPYWWPNPDTPDGLPYIRRDGRRNPEINKFPDDRNLGRLIDAVETLSLAYYFTGYEAYAAKAGQLLRVWFLNPATRMNPNLEYAQAVPGQNTGRGYGLIETSGLPRLADAVGLLAGSKGWAEADQQQLQDWFRRFLQWMRESKNGRDESAAANNHGTSYDVQVASYALFVGNRELAKTILQEAGAKRIARQIEPAGRQPLELARTRAWDYSISNLRGLTLLARLGEHVDVDLWNFRTADGRSIRKAIDYLVPFALGQQKWPYQQLGRLSPQGLYSLLRRAATQYTDAQYQKLLGELPALDGPSRTHLLQPDTGGAGRASGQ